MSAAASRPGAHEGQNVPGWDMVLPRRAADIYWSAIEGDRAMNTAALAWLILRASRWALLTFFLAFGLHFIAYREIYLDQFGHILPTTELLLFALPLAGIGAGLLELMMRDRAGLPRPPLGRGWLPPKGSAAH